MGILTRFNVDCAGCYGKRTYGVDEEMDVVRQIGWFVVVGAEIRRYSLKDRDGKEMTVVVEVREGRCEGEDLTVWLWEWGNQ